MADQTNTPAGQDAGAVTVTPPAAAASAEATPKTDLADILKLAREALITAHPDAVAELITGDTPDELRASVETARAAYARIAEATRAEAAAAGSPAGAPARSDALPPLEQLSPAAKIHLGLRQRQR